MKRSILITGGAGFIGSNLVHYLHNIRPEDSITVVDSLDHGSCLLSLQHLINQGRIYFIHADIADKQLIRRTLDERSITHIAHLAAQSHVDRSIASPSSFIQSNIHGTFQLLEAFRDYWNKNGHPSHWRFLHVSTDEVFGHLSATDPAFDETTAYGPRSPYSASKAASDHLVKAWYHTYGLPTIVSNCSNNYGPYQDPEKLIPLTLTRLFQGKSIPIYGDGKQTRDWLYVEDHCSALDLILQSGQAGESYCVGGGNELSNLDLVQILISTAEAVSIDLSIALPVSLSNQLIAHVRDRPGHDRRYAINPTKIKSELNWEPRITIEQGLRHTVQWYLNNRDWWSNRI